MNTTARTSSLLLFAALVMIGCGGSSSSGSDGNGGDDTPPPSETTSTGVLTDSAIGGVSYLTAPAGKSGITNQRGEYDYVEGDTVIFTVAGLELPAVTAQPRITPQTIADELFSDNATTALDVMLNLAILFQSLDSDGDPSNGITVPEDADVSSLLETDLQLPPASFAAELEKQEDINTVTPPADALAHFYKTELAGSWRLDHIDHPEQGTITPNLDFDMFMSFDQEGHALWVEYEIGGNPADCSPFEEDYSAIYTGAAVVDESSLRVSLESNERALLTGCAAGSTDHLADIFGGEIRLQGEQLEISHPDNSGKAYFQRFNHIKGTPIGVWAEIEPAGETLRNENGVLNFGQQLDGLFFIITEDKSIHVTLDWPAAGAECEYNGVYVAEHPYGGAEAAPEISFGNTLLNHTWLNPGNCGKSLPENETLTIDTTTSNDTLWSFDDGDEYIILARHLSAAELAGDFDQSGVEAPLDLTGDWSSTEVITGTCDGVPFEETDENDYTIVQNGSSLIVSDYYGTYDGNLNGNELNWSGSFEEHGETGTMSLTGTVSSDGNTINGSVNWGDSNDCTYTSTFTATRD